MISKLTDADMQGVLPALLRAAQRAREVARQTNTPLVLVRDGVLVEEWVEGTSPTPADNAAPAATVPSPRA